MTFRSKNLMTPPNLPSKERNIRLPFLKGLTLFFLGASIAVLATYALNIDPAINNAVQYIQKIVLTSDGTAGGTTGIVLDGSGSLQVIGNFVAGASDNQANGTGSFVGGGGNNQANGEKAAVVGGSGNQASGSASFVGGGALNYASGSASFVGGGVDNKANGDASFIGGGRLNQANGNFSFAAGVKAVANANYTFVWNSDDSGYFTGNVTGSFVINAPGGVGINVADPTVDGLEVHGDMKIMEGPNAFPSVSIGVDTTGILVTGASSDRLIAVRIMFNGTVTDASLSLEVGSILLVNFMDIGGSPSWQYNYALIPLPAGKELIYTISMAGGAGDIYMYPVEYPLGL